MKNPTIFIYMLLALTSQILNAQIEIVSNPYFESGSTPLDTNQGFLCTGYAPCCTRVADYFRRDCDPVIDIPSNCMGSQEDIMGGDSYLGFSMGGYRGYGLIRLSLTQNPVIGNSYDVSIVFSLSDESKYSCDSMLLYVAGQYIYINSKVGDSFNWYTFDTTIIATDTNNFMLLAAGYRDFSSATITANPLGLEESFYYVALVSIKTVDGTYAAEPINQAELHNDCEAKGVTNISGQKVANDTQGLVFVHHSNPKKGNHYIKVYR